MGREKGRRNQSPTLFVMNNFLGHHTDVYRAPDPHPTLAPQLGVGGALIEELVEGAQEDRPRRPTTDSKVNMDFIESRVGRRTTQIIPVFLKRGERACRITG